MPQRRFHPKSRRGCLQCKKNRTKCDEKKPRCGRCERIGTDCSLVDQTTDLVFIPAKPEDPRGGRASVPSSDSASATPSLSSPRSLDSAETSRTITSSTPGTDQLIATSYFTDTELERLRLMSHYTLHTAKTITQITVPADLDQSIWGNWVTQLAFEHEFLLHGLLSLSALHLALCGVSTPKHTVMAIHHHGLGISLFRPHISNITDNMYDAVLAFSSVLVFYYFGIKHSHETGAIANLHQVLTLVRGSSIIVKSNRDALKRSRWFELMAPGFPQAGVALPGEVEDALSKLLRRASTSPSADQQNDVYASAIQALRDNLAVGISCRRTQEDTVWFPAITWFPVVCPTEIWPLISAGEPLALAILAHYAVILHWLRRNVWMEGWGKETVEAIHLALPLEWHEYIAWAVRETERS